MKTVTGRIAVMEQQMGVSISDDRKKLVGYLFANLLTDVIEAGNLNVTFVRVSDNIGYCDEENYYGVYRVLFENKTDASLFMPNNANCDRMSPFEAARVVIDHSNNILMLRKLAQPIVKVTSVMGNTPVSTGMLLFALTMCILFGILASRHVRVQRMRLRRGQSTKSKTKQHLSPMLALLVGVGMRQGMMIRSKSGIARALFYLHCWLMMLFLIYFSSDFKTDLMIKEPIETIDTLKDLANSDSYRAVFPLEWNLWRRFSKSQDVILRSIWLKATDNTGNPVHGTISISTSKGTVNPFEMLREMRKGRVFISDPNINRFLKNAYCLGYDIDNKDKMKEIVYLSRESFYPSLLMGIMRIQAPIEFKNRYNFILTCFNEHGFHDFYVKNPLGILKKTSEQKNCFQRMRMETITDGSDQDIRPIIWGNVSRLLHYCRLFLLVAFLMLAIEWTRLHNFLRHILWRVNGITCHLLQPIALKIIEQNH